MSDEIFLKHSKLIQELLTQIEVQTDPDKKFLLNAIRNILILTMWLLVISKNKEKAVCSLNGETLEIPMDRIFAQRAFRRLLLVDAWHQFEYYFSQKIQDKKKGTKKIVESYFEPNMEPEIIKFFRETRNALHGNGKHGQNKPELNCVINSKSYVLSPDKEAEADWPFLFTIIEESLKTI